MTGPLFGLLVLALPIFSESSLERGDQEFVRINYPVAMAIYDSALTTSADSADALWRLARVYVCMADVSPLEQKLRLYRQAEAFAYRCIQTDSMKYEGHTWRAAALGNIAMFEGNKVKVQLSVLIKQELERSISINPADDIAYSILGSFYSALGNITWIERRLADVFLGSLPEGGYDEAEKMFKQAIALAPRVIHHHFELGELYVQQDRNWEALEQFLSVVALPALVASDKRTQTTAARLIKTLREED